MSDTTTNPEAEMLFGDIVDYIDTAQKLIDSDRVDSLEQLNAMVDALGERVIKLPLDVVGDYQPEMDYVTEHLRALTESMTRKRAEMAHDLDVVEKRLKAIRAYYVTPSEGE